MQELTETCIKTRDYNFSKSGKTKAEGSKFQGTDIQHPTLL